MFDVVRTVLYCYPVFEDMMESIEKLVLYKAIKSFSNTFKTVEQAEKIILLNDRSRRIYELKTFVDSVIATLNDEERELLEYKYFHKKTNPDFDYKSRKYYRHQKKLTAKLIKIFERKKFTIEYFEKNYLSIFFIKCKYNRFKKMTEKGIRSKASTDRIL